MKAAKRLVDTTMRDGEQSPGIALTKEQKIKIAQILDAAGVYQIEAGTPSIGGCEIDAIRGVVQARKNARISVFSRVVLDDVRMSAECGPDIIHLSAPVSYVLIYSKLNKNKSWLVRNLLECVEYAMARDFEVTVGFEDASRADITFMATLSRLLLERGVRRIRLADTVGVLSPSRTYRMVRELIEYSGVEVELHAHNDLGMAVANTLAGAMAGADYLDVTVAGLGERAGNCDMLKLLVAAREAFDLGVKLQEARRAHKRVLQIIAGKMMPAEQDFTA